jgi:NAD(P)H-dependent FMN reductase
VGESRVRVLAISGSLRARSVNTSLLEAMQLLSPRGVVIDLYRSMANLPAFNPDDDRPDVAPPPAARDLRARVAEADALVISSPEYAHGIPGALKNLLDWLVGSVEFPGKPAMLVNASERSLFAQAQLAEVLRTMSARVVPRQAVLVPVTSREMDATGIAADRRLAVRLVEAMDELLRSLA